MLEINVTRKLTISNVWRPYQGYSPDICCSSWSVILGQYRGSNWLRPLPSAGGLATRRCGNMSLVGSKAAPSPTLGGLVRKCRALCACWNGDSVVASSLPSAMADVGDSIGLSAVEVASILFPLLAIPRLMLRHASENDSLVVLSVVGSLLSSLRVHWGDSNALWDLVRKGLPMSPILRVGCSHLICLEPFSISFCLKMLLLCPASMPFTMNRWLLLFTIAISTFLESNIREGGCSNFLLDNNSSLLLKKRRLLGHGKGFGTTWPEACKKYNQNIWKGKVDNVTKKKNLQTELLNFSCKWHIELLHCQVDHKSSLKQHIHNGGAETVEFHKNTVALQFSPRICRIDSSAVDRMVYLSLAGGPDDRPVTKSLDTRDSTKHLTAEDLIVEFACICGLGRHLTFPQNEQSLHPDSFWWNISQNTNCSYANLGTPETTQ